MKRITVMTATALLVVISTVTEGRSQANKPSGSACSVSPVGFCETATLETIQGQVLKITRVTADQGTSDGIHWFVKSNTGTIDVHLGPAWYLDAKQVRVKVGDLVEIKGFKTTRDGMPTLIAREIEWGNRVLTLRNAQGIPVWSRQQR